jgi:hypothetical protein
MISFTPAILALSAEVEENIQFALWVGGFVLALVLVLAMLRLFSIDKTLKAILAELQKR